MRAHLLLIISVVVLSVGSAIAQDDPDELKAVEKLELLEGHVERRDNLVVRVWFDEKCRFGEKYLHLLKSLKNLKTLEFHNRHFEDGTRLTDVGVNDLKELKGLTHLSLRYAHITDVGAKELCELENLTSLDLGMTNVTDAGVMELKELKNLTKLSLQGLRISGAGLRELRELEHLTEHDLSAAFVSDEDLKSLRELKHLA